MLCVEIGSCKVLPRIISLRPTIIPISLAHLLFLCISFLLCCVLEVHLEVFTAVFPFVAWVLRNFWVRCYFCDEAPPLVPSLRNQVFCSVVKSPCLDIYFRGTRKDMCERVCEWVWVIVVGFSFRRLLCNVAFLNVVRVLVFPTIIPIIMYVLWWVCYVCVCVLVRVSFESVWIATTVFLCVIVTPGANEYCTAHQRWQSRKKAAKSTLLPSFPVCNC